MQRAVRIGTTSPFAPREIVKIEGKVYRVDRIDHRKNLLFLSKLTRIERLWVFLKSKGSKLFKRGYSLCKVPRQ